MMPAIPPALVLNSLSCWVGAAGAPLGAAGAAGEEVWKEAREYCSEDD